MKKILTLLFIFSAFANLSAQDTKPDTSGSSKIFTIVQVQPKFPGDINKYLRDNLVYPDEAKQNNISGTVYVTFVVEKDGSVSHAMIMRGIPGGQSLQNEALKVVSNMSGWTPGMQNGKPVRVQYMIPIHFANPNGNSPAPNKN